MPEEPQEEISVIPETSDMIQDTTKVDEITEIDVQQPNTTVSPGCYENGYDSINPYLNPYAPVYYYPMSFYPVPGIFHTKNSSLSNLQTLKCINEFPQHWIHIVRRSFTKM